MDHAYWGPSATPEGIAVATAARRADFHAAGCRIMRIADEATLCRRAAAAIAEGKVIGWFQGRLEWGSRPLGNRSVLADPRRADMRRILDLKIGPRDPVRPFALSILREAVTDWFEIDGDVPFMTQAFPIRPERRDRIPAAAPVDGSVCLQTVTWAGNPRYARLIRAFDELAGVPIVINASFDEDAPMMCKPAEAIDCFLRTGMDVLVLGDSYIER
jgi:carbamoyltransferase